MKSLPLVLLSLSALFAAGSWAQTVPTTPSTGPLDVGLIGIGLNVADIEKSTRFYVEGLGMIKLTRNERGTTVEQFLGYPAMPYPPMLELIGPKPGTAPPAPATPPRTSFKIVLAVRDANALNAKLKAAGYDPPPARMNAQAGGGSFFIRDPDGYNVEVVQRDSKGGGAATAPAK